MSTPLPLCSMTCNANFQSTAKNTTEHNIGYSDLHHADIVMSLEHIFGYISSKIGRIWTKLGRGVENGGKSGPIIFFARSLQKPQRKARNANLFRDRIPRTRLVTSALQVSAKNLAAIRESVST